MRLDKLWALTFRDFLIFRRVKWKAVQFSYMPATTVLIWGLFALYSRESALEAGLIVLVINILWAFAQLAQSVVNFQMMEDIWSGSLKQVLFVGFTPAEYIVSRMISSSIMALLVILLMLGLAVPLGFNFFVPDLWPLIGITLIVSLGMAVMVAALLLMLGKEYGFLSWSALQIFILLSAPFFPVAVFPKFIQYISYVMPFTDVFNASRMLAVGGSIAPGLLTKGLIIAIAYFVVSWPIYFWAFRIAKKKGFLAKLA
ncbi:hypothetical protein ACFL0V_03180 [Nanoarchaeota archaeon]